MKNQSKIRLIALATAVCASLTACGGYDSDNSENYYEDYYETTMTTKNEKQIGDFECEIYSPQFGEETYEGIPTIVVSIKFTNNSNKPACFAGHLEASVFQAGVECEEYFDDDFETNQARDVMPGKSITVKKRYELYYNYDYIDIIIQEYLSDDEPIMRSYEIDMENKTSKLIQD